MQLIIAEKPSLARNIVSGIGKPSVKRNGFIECGDYLVSWAFGHLFSLADIEDYTGGKRPGEKVRWTMQGLPCFPREFRFVLRGDGGVANQFHILETLCNRPDVSAILHAGDADREGEIIVRTCIKKALKSEKPVLRLWLPDQTPKTIEKALLAPEEDKNYDNLADEGYARTFIDWLYGVNLTRYATLKTGKFLRVGRVIVPIVKAVYDRDMAIKNFKPETYYAVTSKAETEGEEVELTSSRKFKAAERAKAEAYAAALNEAGVTVTDKKSKKDTLFAGKLYSLSKLQNVLGKKYKMPMEDSLAIVQKLYEEGYLTYPRTNSEYLATAEKDKVKGILAEAAKLGYPVRFKDSKHIFDDKKIESHSALTPTYRIPDKSKLSEREMQVYSTVFRRFVAVFCAEDCVAERSEITLKAGELETFTLKGTSILERGWTKYDDSTVKDKLLPPLSVGQAVTVNFAPVEKETTPPKHYTIETLNNYLKNPFKEDKAAAAEAAEAEGESESTEDEEDYRAIFEGLELGTEATRTGIIDNAKNSRYIALKKDVYTILPEGIYLIEALLRLGISMDKYKTSELGQALKRVFRGRITVPDAVRLAEQEIAAIFKTAALPPEQDRDTGLFGEEVGPCPLCGSPVRRTSFGYGCSAYKEKGCRFSIREVICSRTIPVSAVKTLLTEGKTAVMQGFVSQKTGKSFDAALKLEGGRAVFDFPPRPTSPPPAPPTGALPAGEEPPYPENPLPDWVKRHQNT